MCAGQHGVGFPCAHCPTNHPHAGADTRVQSIEDSDGESAEFEREYLAGGVGAPLLFGVLIQTHSRTLLALGYGLGALLMIVAAICEASFGVEAAGKSLESISKPLQSSS